MLQRDEESKRLNALSKFLRALFYGHLIHPSIPRHELRAVADVGTGTGVWVDDVQQELDAALGGGKPYNSQVLMCRRTSFLVRIEWAKNSSFMTPLNPFLSSSMIGLTSSISAS